MYFEVINETLTFEEFSKAAKEILLTRKYSNFPVPAEFIELAKGNNQSNNELKIQEAANKFKRAVSKAVSVKFDDRRIHEVVKLMGGWSLILKTNTDDLKWKYKEFEDTYRELLNSKRIVEETDEILYSERDKRNIENGFAILPVITIRGDEECRNSLLM
jgi:hypothetical protein